LHKVASVYGIGGYCRWYHYWYQRAGWFIARLLIIIKAHHY
jgi:hypothetical protein